jgi:hypothetical protein
MTARSANKLSAQATGVDPALVPGALPGSLLSLGDCVSSGDSELGRPRLGSTVPVQASAQLSQAQCQ